MRACLLSTILVSTLSPAFASGGLWCEADDAKVKLSIDSGITRGMGNPLFNFRGALEIKDKAVAEDLRTSAFEIGNLTQHWLDGKEMKLQLFRERGGDGPVGEIDLLIETRMVDEGSYEGTYSVRVSDMTGDTSGEGKVSEYNGKASCSAE